MLTISNPEALKILSEAKSDLSLLLGFEVAITVSRVPAVELNKELHLKAVISSICGVEWRLIKGQTKKREVVIARQLFCVFAKFYLKPISLKAIGEMIGDRDHTTVIHSIKTVKEMIETDFSPVPQLFNHISSTLNIKIDLTELTTRKYEN